MVLADYAPSVRIRVTTLTIRALGTLMMLVT
jgi:hypothetical protein